MVWLTKSKMERRKARVRARARIVKVKIRMADVKSFDRTPVSCRDKASPIKFIDKKLFTNRIQSIKQ